MALGRHDQQEGGVGVRTPLDLFEQMGGALGAVGDHEESLRLGIGHTRMQARRGRRRLTRIV
jgi:hypothetical protein